MIRLRTLGIAVVAVAITAVLITSVNGFVPWLMRSLLANRKLAEFLSHLYWVVPLGMAIFMPITYGWYRRRNPRPDPTARLTLRTPLR